MKNCLNLFLLFSFLFLSCSEGSQEKELENSQKNDLEKENLKGDVVFVLDKTNWVGSLEFNDNGMITRKFYFDPKYNIYNEWEYFYEGNKLIKDIEYRVPKNKGLVSYSGSYAYNSNRQLIKYEQIEDEDLETIEYKYENEFIKEKIEKNWIGSITTLYFHSNNQLDSLIEIQQGTTEEVIKTIFHFNKKGQISKELRFHNKLIYSDTNEYDESTGLLIKTIRKFNNEEEKILLYKYQFDKQGNWIKSFVNDEPQFERLIFYKGDDYSSYINEINNYKISISRNTQTEGSLGSNRVPSLGNNSQSAGSINQENNSSQKRKCSQCSGSGQCRECSKTYRGHYWDNRNNVWNDRNESRNGYVMCSNCSGAGVIYKKSDYPNIGKWEVERKCHVGGCMDGWRFCERCNAYGNGRNIGKCERCKGTGQE